MSLTRRSLLGMIASGAVAGPETAFARPGSPDPLAVRHDFPVTEEHVTYLDTAYIGPVPRAVKDAGVSFLEAKARRPISLGEMQAKADEVRGRFARLIGASAEEVGFLPATSDGENLVAHALELKPGDNVVIDELHYETEFVLYGHLEETRGIKLRIARAKDGAVRPADFAALVDGRTRLLSVALVSHQNGFRHDLGPLAALAHAHGAWLYTDAVQAAGAVGIDVRKAGVDALCTGTYKWLHAGFGVAPFYVRRELLDRIPPDRFGALHVEHAREGHRYDLFTTARKFEHATLSFEAIYQLGAALEYLESVGVPRIEAHTTALAHRLQQGLKDRALEVLTPADNASPVVAFRVPGDPAAARSLVQEARIRVSFRENGTQIRVSPALFNAEDDVARFLACVEKLKHS
jgi:selenocysteine lyase/cysteine desulfurase